MNLAPDPAPGIYEARVPVATVAPLSTVQVPVASLPVPVATQPAATALETALANITKLDAGLINAARASFDGRNNAFLRWVGTPGRTFNLLSFAIPAAVTYGVGAAIGGTSGTNGFVPMMSFLVGVVGGLTGLLWRDTVSSRRDGTDVKLTVAEVSSARTMLLEMPAAERAALKHYADGLLEDKVRSGGLTPPAAESLREAIDEGIGDHHAAVRTGRAALLVHDAKHLANCQWDRWNNWLGDVKSLLAEPSGEEKRELATMMLAHCFKNELCTLPLNANQADALYVELRAAQRSS